MQKNKSIMNYESTLPEDFDGFFRFSNPSDEDFIGVWGGKEYLFPSGTSTAIIIPEHSPLEIQHIRKKFAKDLAEREFYKSKTYNILQNQEGKIGNKVLNSIHQAATYTLSDLEPYIKSCLKPLPPSKLKSKPIDKVPMEDKLSRNEQGLLNTEAVDKRTSLRQKALNAGINQ